MALKNQNIAAANPSAIANRAYIDALYMEREIQAGRPARKATDKEYANLSNRTVKDAANIVLGQTNSPFAATKTVIPTKQTTATPTTPIVATTVAPTTQQNKATLSSPDGRYKTVVTIGSNEAARLLSSGWQNKPNPTGQEIDNNLAISFTQFKNEGAGTSKQTTTPTPTQTQTQIDTAPKKDDFQTILKKYYDEKVASGEITREAADFAMGVINSTDTTTGKKIYTDEEIEKIAADYETQARADLDPYYKKTEKEEIESLKQSIADIRNSALRYQQQEEKSYKQTLADTKQSLRSRGLTFSGISRATLGAEGALSAEGIEGTVPQQRRYNWEDALATYQENLRNLGTAVEARVGSADLNTALTSLGNINTLVNPYKSGLTYDPTAVRDAYLARRLGEEGYTKEEESKLALEKKKAVEAAKQERLSLLNK